jgi:hypothetical protein
LARLAGHDGADVNVAVQANVSVDLSRIVERVLGLVALRQRTWSVLCGNF